MGRRITAALLAVLMILLTFGCGKGSGDPKKTTKDPAQIAGKIAIMAGDRSQSPEVFAAASKIASANPESVMLLKYPDDFYVDPNGLMNVAVAAAENQAVKAIVFADGVKGTGAAVRAVREARDDICIVVCNPHEGSTETKDADLVLSVDFPALAQGMVEKAKEMGAENVVLYSHDRHRKYSSVVALRRELELACEDKNVTFKSANSVDLYENGRSLEAAKLFLGEDAPRKLEKFGEKTALICTEPQAQGALAAAAIRYGMIMPGTFLPSPLAIAADLGVDLTNHETDSKYALEKLRADEIGAAGHVATWSFSAYVAFLNAAFDYAVSAVNGSAAKPTVDTVKSWIEKYTDGAEVAVSTDANFAYLVKSDLVTL